MYSFKLEDFERMTSNYVNSLLKINNIDISKYEVENKLETIYIYYKADLLNSNDRKFVENENFEILYIHSLPELAQMVRNITLSDIKKKNLSRSYIVKQIILDRMIAGRRIEKLPREILDIIISSGNLNLTEIKNLISATGYPLPPKYYRIIRSIKRYNIKDEPGTIEFTENVIHNALMECNLEVIIFFVEHENYNAYQYILDEITNCNSEEDLLEFIQYLQNKINYNLSYHNILKESSTKGYMKIIKFITENKNIGKLSYRDINDSIYKAASNGHLDIVKYLIEKHKNKLYTENFVGAISEASLKGYLDIVKYLLQITPDGEGIALIKSSQEGHLDIVRYAFSRYTIGKNKNFKTNTIYMALKYAKTEEIKKFISNNINNLEDVLLYTASKKGKNIGSSKRFPCDLNLNLVKFLYNNGADIHYNNERALQLAIENGNFKIVKFLIENGANLDNMANKYSAIKIAYNLKYKDVTDYLDNYVKSKGYENLSNYARSK